MVDPHTSSTRDDTYHHHHHHPHPHPHPHHYHSAKQSLSAFEYNNSRDVRGADGGITNTNAYTTAQRTTDRVPQIPDGFKASRAFDALDVWKTSVNHSNNYRNDNKASEMSSFHHRTNTNSNVPLPLPKFIRPAVSTQNNSDRSHNMYRQTRNTDVSELFLAEAKAAQAKLDMEIDGNSSLDSFNTYEAMIDRPPLSRQYSSSSVDAVGPIENDTKASKNQLITLQLVDDTVQIATTPSNSRQQEKRQQQLLSKSPRTNRYSNEIDDDDDVDDDHQVHHHHHYRSYRKPIGLTYALRKTDSGSTFQSLDGLSNSSPLIRHESKKKHQRRSSTHNKSKRKKRSSQPSVSSSTIFTSSINTSFMKCYPTDEFDYSNRFICFNAPTCLPFDHLKESFENYRHRYYASTAYQNQHHNASGSVGSTFDDDKFINYNSNNSPSKQREGPEHSPSPSPTRVNVHQQHLLHIREQQQKVTEFDSPEISTTVISSTINTPHPKKIKSKRVQFATTLVTKVNYRPYTPQSEIAVLYFQEEELEELECDRETVSGDQFECQFDEMALAVHIAYQQINPSDE